MKSIWITALSKDQSIVQQLMQLAANYGLEGKGHFWEDDLKKMAWLPIKEKLKDKSIHLWVILCTKEALTEEVRYGLTLLSLALQKERADLPVLVVDTSGKMNPEDLPGIFIDNTFVQDTGSSLGVKFAAMANMPFKAKMHPYYLAFHANPGFGVWFEVGPGGGEAWNGVVFGINAGEIKAHGVGERGRIPEKCVLEYPIKGMKIESGNNEYTAWGIQNNLDDKFSYYIKVDGMATSLMYGQMPDEEQADLHLLRM